MADGDRFTYRVYEKQSRIRAIPIVIGKGFPSTQKVYYLPRQFRDPGAGTVHEFFRR